jgi:hypothetical protein
MGVKHTLVSGKADGGDATLVQPSNWNADHVIDGPIVIPNLGVIPAVPAAGTLTLFIKSIASRLLPAFISPSGLDSVLQPHWGRNRAIYWQPLGNATTVPLTTGIAAPTALGTATARNVATTNIATRIKRLGYVSVATAGGLCGHWWAAVGAQFTTGTGTGLGGFIYMERLVVSDAAAVTGARMFIGMSSAIVAATNVEPNTLTNSFGFAQLSTDATQWYFVYGGSGAQTAIPMGTGLGAPTLTTTAWDIALFANPSTTGTVGYEIKNLDTGISVEGVLTSQSAAQLPTATILLAPRAWRCNNATLLACGLDIASMYIETDQ